MPDAERASLFGRINSVFRRKSSLFRCLGIQLKGQWQDEGVAPDTITPRIERRCRQGADAGYGEDGRRRSG